MHLFNHAFSKSYNFVFYGRIAYSVAQDYVLLKDVSDNRHKFYLTTSILAQTALGISSAYSGGIAAYIAAEGLHFVVPQLLGLERTKEMHPCSYINVHPFFKGIAVLHPVSAGLMLLRSLVANLSFLTERRKYSSHSNMSDKEWCATTLIIADALSMLLLVVPYLNRSELNGANVACYCFTEFATSYLMHEQHDLIMNLRKTITPVAVRVASSGVPELPTAAPAA